MDQAFPTFTTDRLWFRQLEARDVYDVFKLFSDPQSMLFDGGRTMNSINEAFQFISVFSAYNAGSSFLRWAVQDKLNGQFVGTAGFHKISPEARRGEIGGEVMKPFWGQGIAKEALFGLTNYAFGNLDFNRITALIAPDNIGAQKVVQKLGYEKEGRLRDWEFWNGKFMDMDVFSMLKKDWPVKP